jgi:hypothetical protein
MYSQKRETTLCESWQNLWLHSMRGVWSVPKMTKNLTHSFHTLVAREDYKEKGFLELRICIV